MVIFAAVGVLSLVIGVMFLLSPDRLKRINEGCMRMVTEIDMMVFRYHTGLGLSLVIASLLFFFVAYYIHIKG